jgi:hypothetical protein
MTACASPAPRYALPYRYRAIHGVFMQAGLTWKQKEQSHVLINLRIVTIEVRASVFFPT